MVIMKSTDLRLLGFSTTCKHYKLPAGGQTFGEDSQKRCTLFLHVVVLLHIYHNLTATKFSNRMLAICTQQMNGNKQWQPPTKKFANKVEFFSWLWAKFFCFQILHQTKEIIFRASACSHIASIVAFVAIEFRTYISLLISSQFSAVVVVGFIFVTRTYHRHRYRLAGIYLLKITLTQFGPQRS